MRPYHQLKDDRWDAIIIGSGVGGLTTGGLLAKVAGEKFSSWSSTTELAGIPICSPGQGMRGTLEFTMSANVKARVLRCVQALII